MVIDANIIRRAVEADPYLRAEDVAYEHFAPLRDVEAIAKTSGIDFAIPCDTSPFGTTPAPRSHGSSKLPPAMVVKKMLEREPDLTSSDFAKRYKCSLSSAYMIAKEAGVRFAQKKRGPKPKDWLVQALGQRVSDVYHFANAVTVTYDFRGKLMPHFTGPTREILPRLKQAGWKGPFEVLDTHCDLQRLRLLEVVGPFTRLHLDHGKELEVELSIDECQKKLEEPSAEEVAMWDMIAAVVVDDNRALPVTRSFLRKHPQLNGAAALTGDKEAMNALSAALMLEYPDEGAAS